MTLEIKIIEYIQIGIRKVLSHKPVSFIEATFEFIEVFFNIQLFARPPTLALTWQL